MPTAVEYFLKIDGIAGESADAKHKGEIDLESWSWGESQTSTAGGGGGAGKTVRQDFHFVAHLGRQSPKLMLACATGEHIKTATLTVRKAGERALEFLKIRLTDLLVSSYQVGATQLGGDPVPRDQFSLHFVKIEMSEFPQAADGSVEPPVFGGFDFRLNQVIPPPTT